MGQGVVAKAVSSPGALRCVINRGFLFIVLLGSSC